MNNTPRPNGTLAQLTLKLFVAIFKECSLYSQVAGAVLFGCKTIYLSILPLISSEDSILVAEALVLVQPFTDSLRVIEHLRVHSVLS